MESYALFIIVDTHRSSKHKVVKYILPDLYVIVIIVVIVDTIIIISQARGNADKVKAYLILQEILHSVSEDHCQPCIEQCTFHGTAAVIVRILMQSQKHQDL